MGLPGVVFQALGSLVILATFIDIYLTVLQRGSISLITRRHIRAIWYLFRKLASAFPAHRRRILSYAGPTLIPAIVYLWASLLSVGFALLFLPEMGTGVVAASGKTPTGFWPALYFSLMSLVTLGAGDLIATTNALRLLDTFGALAGFTVLTAALSYLMSIYSALTRHGSFALSLHHATGDNGTSIDLLTRLGPGGNFSSSQSTMNSFATELFSLIEAHHTYSVLRYFRPDSPAYALPRIAFLILDTTSLIRTALDQQHYHTLVQSASVAQLQGGGMQMVEELGDILTPDDTGSWNTDSRQEEDAWREHFRTAIERFRDEGIVVTDSPEQAIDRYIELRHTWQPYISGFSDYLMYDEQTVQPGKER